MRKNNTDTDTTVRAFIKECQNRIVGNEFRLPSRESFELSATEYAKFKRLITSIGGEYVSRAAAFRFEFDPTHLLEVLEQGTNYQQATQFFPTPDAIAERLMEFVPVGIGQRILEPSAGRGNLIKALERTRGVINPVIECCELDPFNRAILERAGYKVIAHDFLTLRTTMDQKYDVILMNPPFNGTEHIKHIEHAYEHLKPGGRIALIGPATLNQSVPASRRGSQYGQFREWLDSYASWEELGEGAFKESGTNTNTVIGAIDRPAYDLDYRYPVEATPLSKQLELGRQSEALELELL